MNHRCWIAAAAVVLGTFVLSSVLATSTEPVIPDVSSLPVHYLVNTSSGSLFVTKHRPSSDAEGVVVARGRYNVSCGSIGWDYLHIATDDDTEHSYYASGFLEGFIGSASIAFTNFTEAAQPSGFDAWVDEHIAFMRAQVAANKVEDRFWNQVGKLIRQMEGIADGYFQKTGSPLSFRQVFLANFGSEVGDVQTALEVQQDRPVSRSIAALAASMHCSALIKVTPDDLFVAHDTWDSFTGLTIRVYKVYDFGGRKVAMDSFPAIIASGTDWYRTSNQLSIQETTNVVFNTSLYTAVVPQTVSEFLRVMTANYLAESGSQWAYFFSKFNSGTYNNQYMVVDYKQYVPGQPLRDGLLWIAEQIPGEVVSADETQVLRDSGYWASYNINYFPSLYVKSGYLEEYEQQGTFWSYTKYARPEIFRRNQSDIYDLAGMQRMMRYNDWQNDPYSIIPNCTGAAPSCNNQHTSMLTIASRGDLMPLFNTTAENIAVYGPLYMWVAQGCFGAVDSKIASYKHRFDLRGVVINGPTNDQQPTFSWGENVLCPASMQPPGTPSVYDFPWVQFSPSDL
eukprot:CAMPEP_0176442472 /NCGR_PEP_ID=MMETSP0127-20121128/21834_1 /TAXON_ID=938130 /ORGANISM="Platyophrya macrostoma, Strain WH" /LENGTH=565 /DNA_ID=CAMNT_0017827489 /DNA_START=99 /DNA_END=1796 /DNA_ORIENTATION=-